MIEAMLASRLEPIIKNHLSMPFPEYFKALKALGMKRYTVTLSPFTCLFETKDGETFLEKDKPEYDVVKSVAAEWKQDDFIIALRRTQSGQTGYLEFLQEIGAAGTHHYTVDFAGYKCIYESTDGKNGYSEEIPSSF